MTTKKKTPLKKTGTKTRLKKRANTGAESAAHAVSALLHTMRCIAQHEDGLCELSHELKRSGALSAELTVALREILEKIPAHDFLHDLHAVSHLLDGLPAPTRPEIRARRATPPAVNGKSAKPAKKGAQRAKKAN